MRRAGIFGLVAVVGYVATGVEATPGEVDLSQLSGWNIVVSAEASPGEICAADDCLSLWNGRAPIGDGSFEAADARLTIHRPEHGNGTAIVICPGG
jgi:hypothetical protein